MNNPYLAGAAQILKDYGPMAYKAYLNYKAKSPSGYVPKSLYVPRSGRIFRYKSGKGSSLKRIETKYIDTTVALTTSASAGAISSPSFVLITQGVAKNERIGRSIKVNKIQVKGAVVLTTQTDQNSASDIVRIILYEDRQCNKATIAVTDYLDTASYLSHNQLAESHRFKTLAQKVIPIAATVSLDTTANATGRVSIPFEMNVKCNCMVEYSGTTNNINVVSSRNLGMLIISREGVASYEYKCRIRYID